MSTSEIGSSAWKGIYKLGGLAAAGAVLFGLLEIAITFLPGGNTSQETVLDWFMLLQDNWFMGLRNLGLLNILVNSLGILTFFALYAAHRRSAYQPSAALAMVIAFLGFGVFFATNRAFAMLELSSQFTAASSDGERAVLEAAGRSMLTVGQSHSPGTFLGFFLAEIAGISISLVMLRSGVFGRAAAYAGVIGFGILIIFEILSSFVAGLNQVTMVLAGLGGLLSMVWYILIARRLFQLGRGLERE